MPVFAAEPLDLVQIGVRRGMAVEFAGALQSLGLMPPEPGEVRSGVGRDLLWVQPDTYLLVMPRGAPRMLENLAAFAALVDQAASGRLNFSDATVTRAVSGAKAASVSFVI